MNNNFDDLFNDFLSGDLKNNKKQKKNTKKTDSGEKTSPKDWLRCDWQTP
jgi:hypothetical protein